MSKINKRITVRFFTINAEKNFFNDFVAICQANQINDKPVRVFNLRDRKHLVKIYHETERCGSKAYFLSVIRERNTWQARALVDGTISPINLNQGILGDPYYYLIIPEVTMILGFTTGPSASLRSVANTILQQFRKDRMSKVFLEPISNDNEYLKAKNLVKYSEVRLSVNPTSLSQAGDDLPDIFKGLTTSPFMASSSKLEITVSDIGESGFSQEDLLDAVDYLSDNNCCTSLVIKGLDANGAIQQYNLTKTHLRYSTILHLREQFIDETKAKDIVLDAYTSTTGL